MHENAIKKMFGSRVKWSLPKSVCLQRVRLDVQWPLLKEQGEEEQTDMKRKW